MGRKIVRETPRPPVPGNNTGAVMATTAWTTKDSKPLTLDITEAEKDALIQEVLHDVQTQIAAQQASGNPVETCYYADVDPRCLDVDYKYQREFKCLPKPLVEDFDKNKLLVIIVNYRGGKLWVVDGNHRRIAALIQWYAQNGIKVKLKAMVYIGETYQWEAAYFKKQEEGKSPMTAAQTYKSGIQCGDPIDTLIESVFRDYGMTMLSDPVFGKKKVNPIAAARSAVKKCIKDEGFDLVQAEDMLRWSLQLMTDARWLPAIPSSVNNLSIKALADIYTNAVGSNADGTKPYLITDAHDNLLAVMSTIGCEHNKIKAYGIVTYKSGTSQDYMRTMRDIADGIITADTILASSELQKKQTQTADTTTYQPD